MKRHFYTSIFLITAASLVGLIYLNKLRLPFKDKGLPIVGYAEDSSVEIGSKVKLRVAGIDRDYRLANVDLRRLADDAPIDTIHLSDLTARMAKCASLMGEGCEFPSSFEIATSALPTGSLLLRIRAESGELSNDIFINIRPKKGSETPYQAILVHPDYTWAAYNLFGGQSLYKPKNSHSIREVSLARPLVTNNTLPAENHFNDWRSSKPILSLLKESGVAYFEATNHDIERDPSLILRAKRLVVLAGHDEYWTQNIRNAYENWLNQGRNLLVVGGNTGWWKVEALKNGIRVDRSSSSNRSGLWHSAPIGQPEEQLIGSSFRFAGYTIQDRLPSTGPGLATTGLTPDEYRLSSGLRVLSADHPLFHGTGLSRLQWFGVQSRVVRQELDGVPLNSNFSVNYSKAPFVPKSLLVLADGLAFRDQVHRPGVIVEYTTRAGGHVINLGSIGWYSSIQGDAITRRIVKNAIGYSLLQGRASQPLSARGKPAPRGD